MEGVARLAWTPCNFGGERPWFVCPGEGCGRRVAILYGPGPWRMLCRHCRGLDYASQRTGVLGRAKMRVEKARSRLPPSGTRPKGMHRATFLKLARASRRLCRSRRPSTKSGWPGCRGGGRLAVRGSSSAAVMFEQPGSRIGGSSEIRPVGMLALGAAHRGDVELAGNPLLGGESPRPSPATANCVTDDRRATIPSWTRTAGAVGGVLSDACVLFTATPRSMLEATDAPYRASGKDL